MSYHKVSVFEGTPEQVRKEMNSFFEYVGTLTIHSVTQSAVVKKVDVMNGSIKMNTSEETHLIVTIIWNN